VDKQSVCVKWKQRCDHSSSSSNRSVSVSQHSTLNSQPGLSRSIQPAVPLPRPQSPHISQSWLKEWSWRLHSSHALSCDNDMPRTPLQMAN